METLVGAVVLAWLALVLLAFAMAGMLRQLRDLQAGVASAAGVPATAGGAAHSALGVGTIPDNPQTPLSVRPRDDAACALVLLVDDNCPVCAEVAPYFDDLANKSSAAVDFVVLARTPVAKFAGLTGARFVADSIACHLLDPGWRPAIVVLDRAGAMVTREPAGSKKVLDAVVTDAEALAEAAATAPTQNS
ncbi:hypothetical protein SAMN05421678_102248 [Actinopolymorpha cephalotaxi]|uniref:Thioredoxin domain-containing protein n=1 Tax=Actinopolymorpha cephalotaxi TaxID=504797 RepID=A0A1I2LW05_9ACTN|nr:hypothetical protein [Actinopolymorpha cephalotaxi]NYH81389.1 hypothetical protein [Actinopolymorpha cephalotaxi]SFF81171.1 hypothetical protein SAMN05421678_102248 [Actinopolymorpha cephalotaxi]